MIDLKQVTVAAHQTLREAMMCINANATGIALVLNEDGQLLYTITDGDLRRVILRGWSLDLTVAEWAMRSTESGSRHPITAPIETDRSDLLQLMQLRGVRQVPLVDGQGHVVDLVLLNDLLTAPELAVSAVVMAGGFGTRLRPLTDELPKPMLPIGDRPLMEYLLGQLKQAGIRHVDVTTHYRREKITEYFGDGQAFGLDIRYVTEDRPLGTAGALGLIQAPTESLLVINGDIFTQVDFRTMLEHHREQQAEMTVAVRQHSIQVPYGVIEAEGVYVRHLREKPQINLLVNAGIYLLEPSVFRYITSGERLDMTDLIQRLLDDQRIVINFPIVEYWLDIGQYGDYQQVQDDFKNGRFAK